MSALPCLLDCDPGADDALAILWLLAHPERFDLKAITTVAGNMGLERTTANARRMLDLCGQGGRIPVHAGAHRPIMQAQGKRSVMHGGDGLGDIGLPAPAGACDPQRAALAIIAAAQQAQGDLHLIATGPLTNLALAILLEPTLPSLLKHVTLMGGAAFCPGNATPASEFNFHVDPHAARIVFGAGVPVTMAGLDVTKDAVLSGQDVDTIAAMPSDPARACAALLKSYGARDPHLHDPVVIAWLLAPELFESCEALVEISLADGALAGQSIVSASERHLAGRDTNARVLVAMDRDGFANHFIQAMARL